VVHHVFVPAERNSLGIQAICVFLRNLRITCFFLLSARIPSPHGPRNEKSRAGIFDPGTAPLSEIYSSWLYRIFSSLT
jgi:hypothetical protein